ncbi:MAG: hypothetical protein Q8P95_04770 [bacterium]|nr:hypothetical protein [bacterium]
MSLSEDILRKIKEKAITPRPAWHFWLKNSIFWSIFSVCVLVGAKAVAMSTYALIETDFELLFRFTHHPFWAMGRLFPAGWIILFLLFIIMALAGLQHTRNGYKWSAGKLIGINLLISLLLGLSAYAAGTPEQFEQFIHRRAPYIPHNEGSKEQVWSQPEEGRLAGTIISITDGQILLLDDFAQRQWTVEYGDSEYRGPVKMETGEKIRLGGEQLDEQRFRANIIAPWKKPRGQSDRRREKQL